MSFCRAVLGDVPVSDLGRTYAHEHIVIDPGYVVQLFPDLLLPSVENGAKELLDLKAAGRVEYSCSPSTKPRTVTRLLTFRGRGRCRRVSDSRSNASGTHLTYGK